MTDTPRVPLELTVVERKQLETFLAAAQGSISATDRALVEFEAKLVALRDLPSDWQKVVAEWTTVRGEIERSERESRAARDASLEAHKATLATAAVVAELRQKIISLEGESQRQGTALSAHGESIGRSLDQATTRLAFRALVGFLLATVAVIAVVVAAIQFGTLLPTKPVEVKSVEVPHAKVAPSPTPSSAAK